MDEFFTVNDLRLGAGAARTVRFADAHAALADYRALPGTAVKALGICTKAGEKDLIRCVPLFPLDREGENVLVLDSLPPGWSRDPALAGFVQSCVAALSIRYCLSGDRLLPEPRRAAKKIRDKRLWAEGENAVRWVYVAGAGWLSPAEFNRRYEHRAHGGFCYPLVLKYQLEAKTRDRRFVPLEVSPWDYERLKRRSRETNNQ